MKNVDGTLLSGLFIQLLVHLATYSKIYVLDHKIDRWESAEMILPTKHNLSIYQHHNGFVSSYYYNLMEV